MRKLGMRKYLVLLILSVGAVAQLPTMPKAEQIATCQSKYTQMSGLLHRTLPYLEGSQAAHTQDQVRQLTEVSISLDPGPGQYDAYQRYCTKSKQDGLDDLIKQVGDVLAQEDGTAWQSR